MFEIWETIVAWLELLGRVIMIVVPLVSPVVWLLWKRINKLYKNIDQLPVYYEKIDKINKEVTVDSGFSLKDCVFRMEKKVNRISEIQRIHALDAQAGHFETDENGAWTSVNKSLCDFLGRDESILLGNGWVSLIDQDMREEMRAEYRNCIEEKRDFSVKISFHTGTFSVNAHPMLDNRHKFIGFLGSIVLAKPVPTII